MKTFYPKQNKLQTNCKQMIIKLTKNIFTGFGNKKGEIMDIKNQPSFGMSMTIAHTAQKRLSRRIKSDADVQLLGKYVEAQLNNPVDVEIREEAGKLVAYLIEKYKEPKTIIVLKENIIEKCFNRPLAFVKRCCDRADKIYYEKYAPEINAKLREIFKKASEK